MIESYTLSQSTKIQLALPNNGFSKEFIEPLITICSKYEKLFESYLVLKMQAEGTALLFGFLFFDDASSKDQELSIQNIMTDLLSLFSDGIDIVAICLNDNDQLMQSIQSMTPPFYSSQINNDSLQ